MNAQKIHKLMKKSLRSLGQTEKDRSYAESVIDSFQGFFQKVEAGEFPAYLQHDYHRIKVRVSEKLVSGKKLNREEAQGVVDEFLELLCEVQTNRSPDDPSERFFDAQNTARSTRDPAHTNAWRMNPN